MTKAPDLTVYGIANCDKVRAVMKWCRDHGLACQLHDYRRDGLDEGLLAQLLRQFRLEELVNKRSATWRQLDPAQKQALHADLLRQHPTLIKRPIVQRGSQWWIAPDPAQLTKWLA